MCKELPVILVNKVVDPKRIIGKKWRAEEEERQKGSLTKKKKKIGSNLICQLGLPTPTCTLNLPCFTRKIVCFY
jgi:hypothetical protein